MTVGTLVQYTPNIGEPPVAAVVLHIWPDDKIELYLFHFDSGTHIRAADRSQVKSVLPEAWSKEIVDVYRRLDALDRLYEQLRKSLATPPTIPAPPPVPPSPSLVEPTQPVPSIPIPNGIPDMDTPETVEPTRKPRKSAWPTG